jgi:UDP-N-acetylmuramate--alanine ligase
VIVANVYPAGEAPIAGIDRDALVRGMRAHGHRHVLPLDAPAQLAGIVKGLVRPGDYVVFLGAGSITQWAQALPGELASLKGGK